MAKHKVKVSLTEHEVVNSDLVITVHSDGEKLGQLQISRGSIDWWPAYNSTNHYRLTWEQFDRAMRDHGAPPKV